jgi:prophage DNA circulation protein
MTWKNRLRENIILISPEGTSYTAEWRGDTQSKKKSLGQFKYTKIKKTIVQDLDIESTTHPITIFFTGNDCDIISLDLYKKCDENGHWKITHPTDGDLEYQLYSVERINNPIESGNIYQINLEFIEPADDSLLISKAQIAGKINDSINNLNESSASQYSNNLRTSQGALAANQTSINNIMRSADNKLGSLTGGDSSLSSRLDTINRSISDTLGATPFNAETLASQVQEYIQIPMLTARDLKNKIKAQIGFISDILGLTPESNYESDININNSNELALMAALAGLGKSIISSDLFDVKKDIINTTIDFSNLLIDVTDNLDEIQNSYSDRDIDKQYFSQSESFSDAVELINLINRYLINTIINLKTEKRFTMEKAEAAISVSVREYNSTKETIDDDFDYFVKTNNLTGNEIIMLPIGREIVVYV